MESQPNRRQLLVCPLNPVTGVRRYVHEVSGMEYVQIFFSLETQAGSAG